MNTGRLIILAGGVSSRMKKPVQTNLNIDEYLIEQSEIKSKSMLSVGKNERPFLDYLLYNAREAGYREILIVISEKDNSVRNYYGEKANDNEFEGLNISYAIQKIPDGRIKPLGTADALQQALNAKKEWKGSRFTVCNSDYLYSQKAFKLMLNDEHSNSMIDYNRNAMEFETSKIMKFGVTVKDSEGYLIDLIEKPTDKDLERAKDRNGIIGVSMNIFSLHYNFILPFLEKIPLHPVRNEKELPVAISMMVKEKPKSLFCYPLSEHVIDLTSKEDIPKVKKYLADNFGDMVF
jgi:NDP-sugar pyrophosphorylase family protein